MGGELGGGRGPVFWGMEGEGRMAKKLGNIGKKPIFVKIFGGYGWGVDLSRI